MNAYFRRSLVAFLVLSSPLVVRAYLVSTTSSGAECKWPVRSVPYLINATAGPAGASTALQSAMSTWSTVSGANFQLTYSGTTTSSGTTYDGFNVCSFTDLGTAGTIARNTKTFYTATGQILDSDIQYNTNYVWSTSGEAGKMDLQNIATHELGHSLSLADLYSASDSEKTMYGYGSTGETKKRTLDADDIAGIVYLYPFIPTVTLSLSGSPMLEAGGVATVTATLSGASALPVTVNLSFSGTATVTSDYTRSATSITIPAGSLSGAISLTSVHDTRYEGNETIRVDISSVANGTESGTQYVTATITDDDPMPTVTLGLTGSPMTEAGGVATVTATLSALSSFVTTVYLSFSGTALLTSDYTRSGTSISIPAGSLSGSITLTSVQDTLYEGNEFVIVDISSVVNATELGTQQITATITDDDYAPVITTQPISRTILVGGGATFVAGVTGCPPFFYQWRFNGDNISAATNASYAIVNAQISQAGSYSLVVTNAYGTATSSNALLTVQNELNYFLWSAIPSPQTSGVPFTVSVSARDVYGNLLTAWTNKAALFGAGDAGTVLLQPTNSGAFVAGQWVGSVLVGTVDSNIRLTASDGLGHTGTSSVFSVMAGPLHHFTWSPVATQQCVNVPLAVTITAQDTMNNRVYNFTNSVALLAKKAGIPETLGLIDSGTNAWTFPMYTYYHDARTQVIYLNSEIGGACSITSLAVNVTVVPGQTMNNWTIRMKHTELASYGSSPVWETGWTTVYQANALAGVTGWRTFVFSTPFNYNGSSNVMVDFSFNNASWTSAGQCQSSVMGQNRSIYFYTDSTYGDPLGWPTNSYNPTPFLSSSLPNVRLGLTGGLPESNIQIMPINTALFVDGAWSGMVSVLQSATNIYLKADDGGGHSGTSGVFSVIVDDVSPTISSISSTNANGTYSQGAMIDVGLTFTESVTLSGGNLIITLETGAVDRQVVIAALSNTNRVTGGYTVQMGDVSADLSVKSITLSGGTLRDAAGNDAILNIPLGQNLDDNKNIVIQTLHTLTASKAGGGTISPEGVVSVQHNGSTNFLLTSSAGNHIVSIKTNGIHILGSPYSGNSFTSTNYVWSSVVADGTVLATFATNVYTLTVVSARGGERPGTLTTNYGYAVSAYVTNSPVINGTTQYVCTAGTVAGNAYTQVNSTNVTLTLTNNATLTWQWSTNYWVATATDGYGTLNVTSGWQRIGSSVPISAMPNTYYHFDSWTGSVITTQNPYPLTVTRSESLKALFGENLAVKLTPHWWLAKYGWTSNFDAAEMSDVDHDGYSVWQEYVADTNPTNAASIFRIVAISNLPPWRVYFEGSSTARKYKLYWRTNLVANAWTNDPGRSPVWGQGGIDSITDTNAAANALFYRLEVTLP